MPHSLPAPYRLRPMQLADVDAVTAIEQAAGPSAWTAPLFRIEIAENAWSTPYVLETTGRAGETPQIIGYVVTWLIADELTVMIIAVDEAWRGRGLGELLLLDALQRARQAGATTARLEVRRSNSVAQNLYRNYGFKVVGERKNYYRDNREDALVMTAAPLDAAYDRRLAARWRNLRKRLESEGA